ncbi:MAG TPA: CAP domain-containing protein, partial [Patescibacteria group bacterium]|nr:CAP domain-containing protein [Patescibacteria group bacterium]
MTPSIRSRMPFRRHAALIAAAFVATSVGVLALPAPVAAWEAGTFSAAAEADLLQLTNQARASAGQRAVRLDSSLVSIARGRSKDMIVRDYFSHDIPGAGNVFDVLQARGYCFNIAGENIGWITAGDDAAVQGIQSMFMNSP